MITTTDSDLLEQIFLQCDLGTVSRTNKLFNELCKKQLNKDKQIVIIQRNKKKDLLNELEKAMFEVSMGFIYTYEDDYEPEWRKMPEIYYNSQYVVDELDYERNWYGYRIYYFFYDAYYS